MARRTKRIHELYKNEIVVAADLLFQENLKFSDRRPALLAQLTTLMEGNEQCDDCGGGPCDVQNHIFDVGIPPYVDDDDNPHTSLASVVVSTQSPSLTTTQSPSLSSTSSSASTTPSPGLPGISPLNSLAGQPHLGQPGLLPQPANGQTADIRLLQNQMSQLLNALGQSSAAPVNIPTFTHSASSYPSLPTIPSVVPPSVARSSSQQFGFPFSVASNSSTSFIRPAHTATTSSALWQQSHPPQEQLSQFDLLQQQIRANQLAWQEQSRLQQEEHQRQQDILLQRLDSMAHSQLPGPPPDRPPAHPPLLPHQSQTFRVPTGSSSSHNEMLSNLCGVSVGPLRSFDANDQSFMFGNRRKIVSGMHSASRAEVHQQILWPHHALDFVSVPVAPDFRDLTPNQFAAGEVAIILSQLPPSIANSSFSNRLIHLNRILTYSMTSDWSSCLNMHAAFLHSVEQRQNSWDSWDRISSWHSRHLDVMRMSTSIKAPKADVTKDRSKEKICGVEVGFMRDSKLCVKFQSNQCELESGHPNAHGKSTLSHSCAFCLFKSKDVADHSAQSCPKRANQKVFGPGAKGGN